MASKITVGGGALTHDDILSVAVHDAEVIIDPKAEKETRRLLSGIKAGSESATVCTSTSPSSTSSSSSSSSSEGRHALSTVQSRAFLLGIINQILIAKSSIRAEVAVYLASLLNSRAVPSIFVGSSSSYKSLHAQVLDILCTSSTLSSTCSGYTPLDALGLTTVLKGAAAAVASLAVFGAQVSLSTADAVAAVTIDTVQASADPFDEDFNFKLEAPKGQCNSATNVSCLLEGRTIKPASASSAGATTTTTLSPARLAASTNDAIACVHQIHGSVASSITAAVQFINSELNVALPVPPSSLESSSSSSGAGAGSKGGKKGADAGAAAIAAPTTTTTSSSSAATTATTTSTSASVKLTVRPHSQPLISVLASASEGIDTLLAAAAARTEALVAAFPTATTTTLIPVPSLVAITKPASFLSNADAAAEAALIAAETLQTRVDALVITLGNEFSITESILKNDEIASSEAAVAKEKAKAAAFAAREAAETARIAALPAEERAKQEAEAAKRREKIAKNTKAPVATEGNTTAAGAAAAATTTTTTTTPNPLGLGFGVVRFRAYVASVVAAADSAVNDATQGPTPPPTTTTIPSTRSAYLAVSPYYPRLIVVSADALACIGGATQNGPVARPADGAYAPRADLFLRNLVETMGGKRRKPKIPRGTRDFEPEQMEVRDKCFSIIRGVFKRHGAVEIDTPVFEDKATLMGKYGDEGGKLIYDLADQGGESLSLRYDLTVPFARYLAMHGTENIKRFHIGKVYRRDNPQMARGRFREFYQCDFDVAGDYASMMPDAEVLKVATEILSELPIGAFHLKLNHRKLLDAMLDICGVPASKFRAVCSAIDKLDKESWEDVREELVVDKGLDTSAADAIGNMVTRLKGEPRSLYTQMMSEEVFTEHALASAALAELNTLYKYLDAMGGALKFIVFDMSLARGLDYYTGIIYEAIPLEVPGGVPMGSIGAGGRYDNLVGMFSGTVTPCVGVSIGMERVFSIMEARAAAAAGGLKRTPVSILVASIPSARYDMASERMKVLAELWDAGFSAEMHFSENPKLQKQLTNALEVGIPYLVVLAEDELDRGEVQVKNLAGREAVSARRAEGGIVKALVEMGAPRTGIAATTTTTTITTSPVGVAAATTASVGAGAGEAVVASATSATSVSPPIVPKA